ncbi:MAG: DUF445 domain-containing protein [Syntrophorhabdaceae bacterium]|nr:DUF445 domain-containing protein [Syntrophorhabdaceae bacterium]
MCSLRLQIKKTEELQRIALKRMRIIATSLLCFMACLYLFSSYMKTLYPFFGFLKAFSEAAMVGALADWFAVVALFKRPLNLPIPHTAIVKRHKDRLGENLALFIKENFLVREVLEIRLSSIDFSKFMAEILQDEKNVKKICDRAVNLLEMIINKLDYSEIKKFVNKTLPLTIKKIDFYPFFVEFLEILTENRYHEKLLNELLRNTLEFISKNREKIREHMRQENPWWLPDFVDDAILSHIINRFENTILQIIDNKDHELIKLINGVTKKFITNLKTSDNFQLKIEDIRRRVMEDEKINEYFEILLRNIREKISELIKEEKSHIRLQLEIYAKDMGNALENNLTLKERFNNWFKDATLSILETYADALLTIISDTIKRWDADLTSSKIELAIGKDLQWIRINGTLVGGLIGLLIYIANIIFLK